MSITNNLFGSTTTANSIQITTVGPATTAPPLLGMLSGSTNPLSIANNTMANLTNAGTSTGAVIRGIQYQSPGLASTNANGKASIVANVVRNLTGANSNTNTFGNTVGIFYTTSSAAQPNGGLVDQNTVNTISATNAGAVNTVAGGIYMSNPAGAVVSNNKVYDIRNASTGTTATTPPVAYGMRCKRHRPSCRCTTTWFRSGTLRLLIPNSLVSGTTLPRLQPLDLGLTRSISKALLRSARSRVTASYAAITPLPRRLLPRSISRIVFSTARARANG